MSATNDGESLLSHLEAALEQGKEQAKRLDEQSQLIAKLEDENAVLQCELAKERESTRVQSNHGSALSIEALVLQNAQKQREIDRLKGTMGMLRTAVDQFCLKFMPYMLLAAPGTSGQPASRIPRNKQEQVSKETRQIGGSFSTQGKSNPLTNVATEKEPDRAGGVARKRKRPHVQGDAISALAEDGEEVESNRRDSSSRSSRDAQLIHARLRLENLLSPSFPSTTPLKTRLTTHTPSSASGSANQSHASLPPTSIEDHDSPPQTQSVSMPVVNKDFAATEQGSTNRQRFLRTPSHNDPSSKQACEGPFKAVPNQECLPGCTKSCCSKKNSRLAASPLILPPAFRNMTDDDILRQYLGYRSDDKIRNLTKAARENLLHDAKTKIIANNRSNRLDSLPQRRPSPPGFWSTDWPSSQQEGEENPGQ